MPKGSTIKDIENHTILRIETDEYYYLKFVFNDNIKVIMDQNPLAWKNEDYPWQFEYELGRYPLIMCGFPKGPPWIPSENEPKVMPYDNTIVQQVDNFPNEPID